MSAIIYHLTGTHQHSSSLPLVLHLTPASCSQTSTSSNILAGTVLHRPLQPPALWQPSALVQSQGTVKFFLSLIWFVPCCCFLISASSCRHTTAQQLIALSAAPDNSLLQSDLNYQHTSSSCSPPSASLAACTAACSLGIAIASTPTSAGSSNSVVASPQVSGLLSADCLKTQSLCCILHMFCGHPSAELFTCPLRGKLVFAR